MFRLILATEDILCLDELGYLCALHYARLFPESGLVRDAQRKKLELCRLAARTQSINAKYENLLGTRQKLPLKWIVIFHSTVQRKYEFVNYCNIFASLA